MPHGFDANVGENGTYSTYAEDFADHSLTLKSVKAALQWYQQWYHRYGSNHVESSSLESQDCVLKLGNHSHSAAKGIDAGAARIDFGTVWTLMMFQSCEGSSV